MTPNDPHRIALHQVAASVERALTLAAFLHRSAAANLDDLAKLVGTLQAALLALDDARTGGA